MRRFVIASAGVALALAGCGTFEDPTIVIDLRVLGMQASPPEQLVPLDPANPPDPSTLQLAPVDIEGLVADPGAPRDFDFELVACPPTDDLRCDPAEPSVLIGGNRVPQPDHVWYPGARLEPSPELFAVIRRTIETTSTGAFGQVDIMVSLRVNPVGGLPEDAVYAAKRVRFGAQLPADRTPNQNPYLDEVDVRDEAGNLTPLPRGRCDEIFTLPEVPADGTLDIDVHEPDGVREDYVVPTFTGGSRMFTESLTYQWFAGAGKFKAASTGGIRDATGAIPMIDNKWTAPAKADVPAGGLDVPLWIIQRDERLGESWFETCFHVVR